MFKGSAFISQTHESPEWNRFEEANFEYRLVYCYIIGLYCTIWRQKQDLVVFERWVSFSCDQLDLRIILRCGLNRDWTSEPSVEATDLGGGLEKLLVSIGYKVCRFYLCRLVLLLVRQDLALQYILGRSKVVKSRSLSPSHICYLGKWLGQWAQMNGKVLYRCKFSIALVCFRWCTTTKYQNLEVS
jgi:hypothetical protein